MCRGDTGNAGAASRPTSDDVRVIAVRVDHIRPGAIEEFGEPRPFLPVGPVRQLNHLDGNPLTTEGGNERMAVRADVVIEAAEDTDVTSTSRETGGELQHGSFEAPELGGGRELNDPQCTELRRRSCAVASPWLIGTLLAGLERYIMVTALEVRPSHEVPRSAGA